MVNIILVGGGGLAREVLSYIPASIDKINILGFIDDSTNTYLEGLPHLGKIDSHLVNNNYHYLITIGSPVIREEIFNQLKKKKAKFYTFIHPSSIVSNSSEVGEGSIICPHSIINVNSKILPNTLVNVFCSIGHEAEVGEHSVLSPYVSLSGGSKIGKTSFLGTRATLFPNAVLGSHCKVSAHTCIKGLIENNHFISHKFENRILKDRFIKG